MTADLAYREYGDPANPAVVFLGSIGSDATMWAPQAHALSNRYRVVCADHRGHGGSPAPQGPYTVAELGGDVLALLDRLELGAVHLVGLSLGGAVAQWLAARHPSRVRTLTLLCTSPAFTPAQGWIDRAETVRTQGLSSIAEPIVERWFTAGLAERDPELIHRHLEMVRGVSDEGYAGCCEALADWDGRGDLARIVAPTLAIAGEQDPATPPATLRTIAEGVADARLEVLDPGAHLVSVEQAGPVTALIARHIAATSTSGYTAATVPAVPAPTDRADAHAAGMLVRRTVLGDAHVDRSIAATTEFTAPFQDFITRTAWGDVWNRPGMDHHTRRLLTLAVLTALGTEHELDMHIRAALRAGTDPGELVEVFLHTAIYAGVPRSNRAFALGQQALADLGEP
ncbi:bifunctional 3-oxoadipate enol-lactonase/4-carboxymuconolactone decarboxylase PcaDC [Nocardia jiangxiensis]|uniref:bifunctional 3-oxoadipate enol-lactonase/4-carboxymuconolactone decarboxylase PcaDC n=1 Tax=Nocardia jiangxiensis TaxID=282685 RepID=UPI0002DCF3E2|nr:3-oxoadipate enol-lactonase [Nocardia jiangxiensis]